MIVLQGAGTIPISDPTYPGGRGHLDGKNVLIWGPTRGLGVRWGVNRFWSHHPYKGCSTTSAGG